jgi:hypothetical protein
VRPRRPRRPSRHPSARVRPSPPPAAPAPHSAQVRARTHARCRRRRRRRRLQSSCDPRPTCVRVRVGGATLRPPPSSSRSARGRPMYRSSSAEPRRPRSASADSRRGYRSSSAERRQPRPHWRASSPAGGSRPPAFGTSATRKGLPWLAGGDGAALGARDFHNGSNGKLKLGKIAPPPRVAYVPTQTMQLGSADGSGWAQPERTRNWQQALRQRDRGGPIEYVGGDRTRTWNERPARTIGHRPGSSATAQCSRRPPARRSALNEAASVRLDL